MDDVCSARARTQISRIAAGMLTDVDPLLAEIVDGIIKVAPELGTDASIRRETRASTRANAVRWLGAMVRKPGEPLSDDVPPDALDLARSLVRRGIDIEVMLRAYRRGQNLAWEMWLRAAARMVEDEAERVEVIEASSKLMFDFVDRVLTGIQDQLKEEHEDLISGGIRARRTETVRVIVDNEPVDEERASFQLGYELARRHTALVVWAEAPGAPPNDLERTASALAAAAEAGRPLILRAANYTLWVWLGTDRPFGLEPLRAVMAQTQQQYRAVVGPTRQGLTGFRLSHLAARSAHQLLEGHPVTERDRLTSYDDVEVVALAAKDPEQADEFVRSVLGPLANADPAVDALRETVRVYLDEGGNGPRAAKRLQMHRNTVLHRVARAEQLLGYPVSRRRLALSLALELVHRLGVPGAVPPDAVAQLNGREQSA